MGRFKSIQLEEEVQMYRSCFQHHFEQSLLGSYNPINQRKAPSIFGDFIFDPSISDKRVHATFTGGDLGTAIRILYWKSEPHKPRINLSDKEILTDHPMILRIALSQKYNGRLYKDGNEGILATGDIDLDDIDVLFSSRTNKLNPRDLDKVAQFYLEEIRRRFDQDQPDLLQKYEERPREIIDRLALFYVYGPNRYAGSEEQKQPIRKFLETLKAKI